MFFECFLAAPENCPKQFFLTVFRKIPISQNPAGAAYHNPRNSSDLINILGPWAFVHWGAWGPHFAGPGVPGLALVPPEQALAPLEPALVAPEPALVAPEPALGLR